MALSMNDMAVVLIIISIFIMLFSMIGVLAWYFVFFQYKHTIEIISLHGKNEKIRIKKAKDFILKDLKTPVWKLRFSKSLPWIQVPPDNVIKTTEKGKNFVRMYLTETQDPIWCDSEHPKLIPHFNELLKEVPSWIENIPDITERQKKYDEWRQWRINEIQKQAGDNFIVFKPYTTNHRVMQTMQIQRAYEQKNKGMGDRLTAILNLLPVAILALVVVVGMIFWTDLAQPSIDKQREITAQKELDTQQFEIIKEIKQNTQEIKQTGGSGGGEEPPY